MTEPQCAFDGCEEGGATTRLYHASVLLGTMSLCAEHLECLTQGMDLSKHTMTLRGRSNPDRLTFLSEGFIRGLVHRAKEVVR